MRSLCLVSDLHIDYNLHVKEEFIQAFAEYEGILLLAGDVCDGTSLELYREMILSLLELNPHIQIIAVAGNHEFYGSTIKGTHAYLGNLSDETLGRYSYLNQDIYYHDDLIFYGATLWYGYSPDAFLLQDTIADCSEILDFNAQVAIDINTSTHKDIVSMPNDVDVWIFHHLPSFKSVAPRFRNDRLNCYFVDSNVERLIELKQPKLVVHGHCHRTTNYHLGKSMIACNAKGHKSENFNFGYQKYNFFI